MCNEVIFFPKVLNKISDATRGVAKEKADLLDRSNE